MNEFPNTSGGKNSGHPILWLLLAFAPSVVGIICIKAKLFLPLSSPVLLVLDVACSVLSATVLARRAKSQGLRVVLTVLMFGFFFLFNIILTLFVGCTSKTF
jgi:hypothetical protein